MELATSDALLRQLTTQSVLHGNWGTDREPEPGERRCILCGLIFPEEREFFTPQPRRPDGSYGLSPRCKFCVNARRSCNTLKNPDQFPDCNASLELHRFIHRICQPCSATPQ